MRDFLNNLISTKENELVQLRSQIQNSEDINEVRSCTARVDSLQKEISEARSELSKLDSQDSELKVLGKYSNEKREENYLDSMEYRKAFMEYVQTGKWNYEKRDASGTIITEDVGKVIPNTILQELIKDLHVYGRLYNLVRHLNVKGGVEFPIETLVPEVKWIAETAVSPNQSAPEIKTSVSFGYYVAEARISQSLLSSIVSLDILESEIAKILAEAFMREFDNVIVNGTGVGQPTGILNETRILADHKIAFNATEIADWKSWRTKLFAKVGLAYRDRGVFIMTPSTWESYMMTLTDDANRPLYEQTFDATNGTLNCRFAGHEVILVEPYLMKNYSEAAKNDAFCIYFNPKDYAINTNLQVGFKRYFNDDTNQWINKGLCVMDGKMLDVNGCFVLTKGGSSTSGS